MASESTEFQQTWPNFNQTLQESQSVLIVRQNDFFKHIFRIINNY
jgi:hypothetical protein